MRNNSKLVELGILAPETSIVFCRKLVHLVIGCGVWVFIYQGLEFRVSGADPFRGLIPQNVRIEWF